LFAATITVRVGSTRPPDHVSVPRPSATLAQTAGTAPQAGYVGSDTCTACHAEGDSLKGTAHGLATNPRSPAAGRGCESCHGPGQAHVDDDEKRYIRRFDDTTTAAETSASCLTCHNRGEHAAWEGSAHERRSLSCATCHSVHGSASFEHQLVKDTQTDLCATCHQLQVAKTERAVAHMPVREGKMSCSSCHNPHGSLSNVKALKTGSSVAESCMSCHAEMRGPMLWEHAPVRENCATCHDPHGSSNDRMLTVRMPMLCQRCHIATRHPSNIYDNNAITVNKSNRMFGRSCVNCHSNIHGSNHPSGQFYMR
jgi:DmsE family decaheme c-type cytochrome